MKGEKASVKLPVKMIIPILTAVIGIVFFYIGVFEYGFWDSAASKPTKGFFPVIIATALIALSILSFINGLKSEKLTFSFKNWLVPISVVLIIISSYVIGLVLSIGVFLVLWLKVYEKQSLRVILVALAVTLFIVVGCFQLWLGIDFPQGIILDMILG